MDRPTDQAIYVPPNLIGTASFNGEILIWSEETKNYSSDYKQPKGREALVCRNTITVFHLICILKLSNWLIGYSIRYANIAKSGSQHLGEITFSHYNQIVRDVICKLIKSQDIVTFTDCCMALNHFV